MKTLDEVIKDNKHIDVVTQREEILKNFEANISNIKNEFAYLCKDKPSLSVCANMMFALTDDLNKKYHSIYNEMTKNPESLKKLISRLKNLKTNLETNIKEISSIYYQIDQYLNLVKKKTQSEHVNQISNLFKETANCYKELFNTFLDDNKKLDDKKFKEEIFGDKKIDFLEAQTNVVIIDK